MPSRSGTITWSEAVAYGPAIGWLNGDNFQSNEITAPFSGNTITATGGGTALSWQNSYTITGSQSSLVVTPPVYSGVSTSGVTMDLYVIILSSASK